MHGPDNDVDTGGDPRACPGNPRPTTLTGQHIERANFRGGGFVLAKWRGWPGQARPWRSYNSEGNNKPDSRGLDPTIHAVQQARPLAEGAAGNPIGWFWQRGEKPTEPPLMLARIGDHPPYEETCPRTRTPIKSASQMVPPGRNNRIMRPP